MEVGVGLGLGLRGSFTGSAVLSGFSTGLWSWTTTTRSRRAPAQRGPSLVPHRSSSKSGGASAATAERGSTVSIAMSPLVPVAFRVTVATVGGILFDRRNLPRNIDQTVRMFALG
jgi:hypothetical protein